MSTPPVSPEKQAEVGDLARVILEAVDAEIGELVADLAMTDDAHLFGDNEFRIRTLAQKIAAKAIELHLARKKTMTRQVARNAGAAKRRGSSQSGPRRWRRL
jgi:hypothetical protein